MRRLHDILIQIERTALVVLMAIMTIALLLQVIQRYFGVSLAGPLSPGLEEVGRFAMIWLTFVGGGLLVAQDKHITVTYLGDSIGGPRLRSGLIVLGQLFVLVISVLLIPRTLSFISSLAGVRTPGAGLPRSLIFTAAVVGFGLMALHALVNIVGEFSPRVRDALARFRDDDAVISGA